MTENISNSDNLSDAKGKIIVGSIVLVLGQLSPIILIPVVVSLNLSSGWTTALSGLLMFGFPELAILASVAIMGKEGFNFIKGKAFGYFKRIAPPDTVSNTRYKIGLVMFIIPFLIAWLLPYFTSLIPAYNDFGIYINIGGDLLLIISLFVLGGDFWDKLRSLFLQNVKVSEH
jgi:hypothetical protein